MATYSSFQLSRQRLGHIVSTQPGPRGKQHKNSSTSRGGLNCTVEASATGSFYPIAVKICSASDIRFKLSCHNRGIVLAGGLSWAPAAESTNFDPLCLESQPCCQENDSRQHAHSLWKEVQHRWIFVQGLFLFFLSPLSLPLTYL